MKRIERLSSSIPITWFVIAACLLFGLLVAIAVSTGRTKTVSFLFLPALIFMFRVLSERLKFWLLALSIPLSIAQIPSLPLPYGTSMSEAILLVLVLDEILFPHSDQTLNLKPLNPALILSFGLFSFAGLIANLRGGDIYWWNAYCLTPLITLFLISRKIHNREDAWLLVELSLLTIAGFLVVVEWAMRTGHFQLYDPLHTETTGRGFRMADGMIVVLGPIRLTTFATRLGAIAALGCPACVLLFINNRGKLWRKIILLLIMAGFGYVLILSATRGSVVAAILGSLLVILISGRFRSPAFLGSVVLSLLMIVPLGAAILDFLPAKNIQRIQTLLQGVHTIPNYHQRMDVLALAWNITLKNPFGVGFGYLYSAYRIDDAIIYAGILQGTGILGALAFIMLVVILTLQFGLAMLKFRPGDARDLASIGVSSLAAGLLAGVSSQSILFEPVHAFVFWMLMAVCYCSITCVPS